MKMIMALLCAFNINVHGLSSIDSLPPTNDAIIVQFDGEGIKEHYDHMPEMDMIIKDEHFDPQISVYLQSAQQPLEEITAKWEKDLENEQWKCTYRFDRDVQDGHVLIKKLDQVLYESPTFQIEIPKHPTFKVQEQELEEGGRYVYQAATLVTLTYPKPLDIQNTAVYQDDALLPLTWNESHDAATFLLEQDGVYQPNYVLQDCDGNKIAGKSSFTIVLDQMESVVEVYANDQVIKEEFAPYYQKTMRLSVLVQDPTFDANKSSLYINDQNYPVEWEQSERGYASQITLADGNYQFAYDIWDEAGHRSTKQYTTFHIDTQAPIFSPQIVDGRIAQKQTLQMQINDTSIQPGSIVIHVLYNHRREYLRTPTLIQQDDHILVTSIFDEEGDYEVYVEGSDYAGNRSKSDVLEFTIDQSAPMIHLTYQQKPVQPKKNYIGNRSVHVAVDMQDAHALSCVQTLYKDGTMLQQVNHPQDIQIDPDEQQNHQYRLVVEAQDQAGNIAQQECLFEIRTQIAPIEIANDVFHGSPFSGNWTPHIKGESEDYRVVQTFLYRNHKRIPYHWKDEIKEEGAYTLEIFVEDKARNRARLKEPFHFVIDKTPPVIALLHKEHGGIVEKQVQVHAPYLLVLDPYIPMDQQQARFEKIRINDEEIDSENMKYYVFTPTEKGNYRIEAQGIDEAGNRSVYTWNVEAVDKAVTYQKQEQKIHLPKNFDAGGKRQSVVTSKDAKYGVFVLIAFLPILAVGIYYVRKRKH